MLVAGVTACPIDYWKGRMVLYAATNGGMAFPVNGTIIEPRKIVAISL
jgi:hypothetical protein